MAWPRKLREEVRTMVKLIAQDGVGNVIHQEHVSMGAACAAADLLRADGFESIEMMEV